jgi:hypothetical protein
MKKRTSAWVLLLVTAGVLLSHLSWEEKDNGHLLMVDGVALDVVGRARDRWTQLTRQCTAAVRVSENDLRFSQARAVIQAYSPPASASAQLQSLWSVDDWLLAEVAFNDLLPAVVLQPLLDSEVAPPVLIALLQEAVAHARALLCAAAFPPGSPAVV